MSAMRILKPKMNARWQEMVKRWKGGGNRELTGRKEAYHGREESPATSDRRESHCRNERS